MPELPGGTLTFLFTDIEGSTRLWERCPEEMRHALARHDVILREVIETNQGHVFKTVGDAFCAAFPNASSALNAALHIHLALQCQQWGNTGPLRVRMGLHTGEAEERDNDYFGRTLNRVARLQSVGHGQQTLLSERTYERVKDSLPTETSLDDMGMHRLKDLAAPEHVWQLRHPLLPTDFPPLKSLDYLPTNLPQQLTSFISREKEMSEIKSLLQKTRLLTLSGSGGAGKTRLSLQAGADLLEDYPDGVWLVELAPLAEPSLVAQTVAAALHIREEPGRPILETLTDSLRDKTLLLLLDNCEHVLDASATLADTLLKRCPNLRILASSRESLGIAGEQGYRIPSLSLPNVQAAHTPESLMRYEAVRLFVERAAAVLPDFALAPQNASALAAVCQRVDGIPLAIELAAARMRLMTVEELEYRLSDRFRILTGGSRTALPRQQTLRALIDWSYDLLEASQQVLFARLSVFAGGWSADACEQVCAGEGVEAWEVLDLLTALVDKSLVIAEAQGARTRYRLLETVRQYAREKLMASGESEAVRERHQACYLALAEEADPHLRGPEQGVWLERLEAEHDNLRGALDGGPTASRLRMCQALWWFWIVRGYLGEGRSRLSEALREREGADPAMLANVLNGAGAFAYEEGDYAAARKHYEESLAIARQLGDKRKIAGVIGNMGGLAQRQGAYTEARVLLEECLALFREVQDKGGIASSLFSLSIVSREQGAYAAAQAFLEESLSLRREQGDKRSIAGALNELGLVASDLGDYKTARHSFSESLALKREMGDKVGIANSLHNLGIVYAEQKAHATAQELLEESLALRREVGDKRGIAASLMSLGTVCADQGDYDFSRPMFREGLALRREIGDKLGIAFAMEALAGIAVAEGNTRCGVRMWGAAEALREIMQAPLPFNAQEKHAASVTSACHALGDAAFLAAWSEGRAMTLDISIAFALEFI